jgi:hypothetical protein
MFSLILLLTVSTFLLFGKNASPSARLGFVSALSLSLVGMTVPFIWNWSRFYGTPGLLPSHFLSKSDVTTFNYLFLLIGLGSLLSGLMFSVSARLLNDRDIKHVPRLNLKDVRDSKIIPLFGLLTLLFLILGLGRAVLMNEGYLTFSGSQTLLRAANALLPASLVSLGFAISKSKYKRVNLWLFLTIFLVQAGRGSRIVLIMPLVITVILLKKVRSTLLKIGVLVLTVFLSLVLIEISFSARNSSSGLLGLPEEIMRASEKSLILSNFIPSVGRLLASLTSWAPTVISSIPETSKSVILRNLNPLIGSGSDALSYSSDGLERLYPYVWVPLSSLGQIYGAFGGIALILIMFLITTVAALSLQPGTRRDSLTVFSLLSLSTYMFQFPLFFQYSSRIWLRVLWLLVLFTVLHMFFRIRIGSSLQQQGKEYRRD